MDKILISVIVPIHNMESYLSQCIDSIVKQTYSNLQIILVDDGSTDGSGEICDRFADIDSRIEVIHQKNRGVTCARKSGLQKACGRYIGFVDSDDYIEPQMYERLLEEIIKSGADFIHFGYWEENAKKSIFEKQSIETLDEILEYIKLTLSEGKNCLTPSMWSKLFKADIVKRNFMKIPDECVYGEDLINLCRCMLEADKVALVDEAYYHYRVRSDSADHSYDVQKIMKIAVLYANLCRVFVEYECYECLKDVVERWYWNVLRYCLIKLGPNEFWSPSYYYKEAADLQGKSIVLYGAGNVGRDYYAQISRYTHCDIVAWVDAHPEKYHYQYIEVQETDVIRNVDFDILLIAVASEKVAVEIERQLIQQGVEYDKIYWSKPCMFDLGNVGL